MFANVEREREMCVCVLFEFRQFFYSGNSSTYFKVCVDLCKKNLIVRDVQRFQFLSTILNWNSSESVLVF